jgi:hypothetical protein
MFYIILASAWSSQNKHAERVQCILLRHRHVNEGFIAERFDSRNRSHFHTSFNTQLDLQGVRRAFRATDNFFWQSPGEERLIGMKNL